MATKIKPRTVKRQANSMLNLIASFFVMVLLSTSVNLMIGVYVRLETMHLQNFGLHVCVVSLMFLAATANSISKLMR